jgi:glycosyltransferase involved in cell wall biosynthesis
LQKKNIIIVSNRARSLINFRGDMIQMFLERDYNVVCLAPEGLHLNVFRSLRSMGANPYIFPLDRTGNNVLSDLKSIFVLAKIFYKIRSADVLSYTVKPVLYGSVVSSIFSSINHLSMITGMPSIVKSMSLHSYFRFVLRKIMGTNSRIFFQNADDEHFFENQGYLKRGQAVRINGSGINLDKFSYSTPSIDGPISFLLIARLLAEKGIREFVEAANIVTKQFSNVKFSIVGWFDANNPDRIEEDEFYSLIENGSVEFLGKYDDVRPVIASHCVYVLPSYHEGMPRTVLEAMAIGRPIITTDVPGCRDTVEEGVNGYLVPKKNAVLLAESMKKFITVPELVITMGNSSRDLAEKWFDVNAVNEKILAALKSMIK